MSPSTAAPNTRDYTNKSSPVAQMGDRARAKCAEKWGLLCLFPWGICMGPHLRD